MRPEPAAQVLNMAGGLGKQMHLLVPGSSAQGRHQHIEPKGRQCSRRAWSWCWLAVAKRTLAGLWGNAAWLLYSSKVLSGQHRMSPFTWLSLQEGERKGHLGLAAGGSRQESGTLRRMPSSHSAEGCPGACPSYISSALNSLKHPNILPIKTCPLWPATRGTATTH